MGEDLGQRQCRGLCCTQGYARPLCPRAEQPPLTPLSPRHRHAAAVPPPIQCPLNTSVCAQRATQATLGPFAPSTWSSPTCLGSIIRRHAKDKGIQREQRLVHAAQRVRGRCAGLPHARHVEPSRAARRTLPLLQRGSDYDETFKRMLDEGAYA